MSQRTIEALRERTRTAQQQKIIAQQEAQQQAAAERESRDAERRQQVAQYVAGILKTEIRKMQDGANAAADNGESVYSREWLVRSDTTTERDKGHKIALDIVELETAKAASLQEALVSHMSGVGFAATPYVKPVGYNEEVIDYGTVFHETGKLYGVTISWADDAA
jgi:hypothetical protein